MAKPKLKPGAMIPANTSAPETPEVLEHPSETEGNSETLTVPEPTPVTREPKTYQTKSGSTRVDN